MNKDIIKFIEAESDFEKLHRGSTTLVYQEALGATRLEIGPRWPTIKLALNLLAQVTPFPRILETGCLRKRFDYGAGCSTVVFCDFLNTLEQGGTLVSVDINQENVSLAAEVLKEQEYPEKVHYNFAHAHSVQWIKELFENDFVPPQEKYFDLVYLDSQDADLNDESITKQAQLHQAEEVFYTLHLSPRLILLDDNKLPFGGKCLLAKQRLWDSGRYILLYEDYQSLWLRK